MSAGQYNMIIEQGALYFRTFTLKDRFDEPFDLTTVIETRGQIRRHAAQAEPTALISVEIVDAAKGVFTISVDEKITEAIPAYKHYYDVEFVFDDTPAVPDDSTEYSPRVHRMLNGMVDVRPNITR